jgi:hypothetical protein
VRIIRWWNSGLYSASFGERGHVRALKAATCRRTPKQQGVCRGERLYNKIPILKIPRRAVASCEGLLFILSKIRDIRGSSFL